MISTLLVWIYIFILTSLTGHFVFRVIGHFHKEGVHAGPSLSELSITGLTFLGIFLSFFSLFQKIGLTANLILIAFCLIYFIIAWKSIVADFNDRINELMKFSSVIKILVLVYIILILISAQSIPTVSDTGLYHIQNIKWINSYRVVPGLGNLHGRFAFNNHSFLPEALFSFSFLRSDFFHLLNSYLLIILSSKLIILAYKNFTRNLLRSIIYAGLLILLQIFYLKSASSPTPDIFSLTGIWFIFIIYLERIAGKNDEKVFWIPVLFMAFFLVTVKLSAFPVAFIFILFLSEYDQTRPKKLLIILMASLLVFVPYFIRNYILSGYLIYPYPSLNLFNPDWKIPLQYVNEMESVISSHAQSGDWQQRAFSEWLPIWFSNLSTGFKIISGYILVSPLLIAAVMIFSRETRKLSGSDLKIAFLCFVAIVFWFVSAPNFRFIYAFLFFYLLLTSVIFVRFLLKRLPASDFIRSYRQKAIDIIPGAIPVMLLLFSVLLIPGLNYKGIEKCMIFPTGFPEVQYDRTELNNFYVNIPVDGTYCWNLPLPSSIIQKHIGVNNIEMKGPDYKYGFRIVIERTEEIIRLKEILRNK